MIPFGNFEPDRSDFDPETTGLVTNVVPVVNGYGPFPSFETYATAMSARPLGAIRVKKSDGTTHMFAGTATKLWKLNTATLAWADVSAPATTYAANTERGWSFTQYGDWVVAVNGVDAAQYYDMASASAFAAIAGSPPIARYVGVIGDFLVMLGVAGTPNKLQWSGFNAPAYWTVGNRSSDFQQFPDGGDIMGFAGFERGAVVFQENAIREMSPAYETPMIFTFRKTEETRGAVAARSIVQAGTNIFFLTQDGFYRYGQPSEAIGKNRVDKWFRDTCDPLRFHLVEGMADPAKKVVYWRFKSIDSNYTTSTDQILMYHYGLDRWSRAEVALSGIMSAASPGYTLDNMDTLFPSIDDMPFSLDSPALMGGVPVLAGFNRSFVLGFFAGQPEEATLQTADNQLGGGRRSFVTGFRPVTDAATVYGRVAGKNTHGAALVWNNEFTIRRTGLIPARSSALLHRFELRVPADQAWTHVHGIDPVVQGGGEQ